MTNTLMTPVKRSKVVRKKCVDCYSYEKMRVRLYAGAVISLLWIAIFINAALNAPTSLAAVITADAIQSPSMMALFVGSVAAFYALVFVLIAYLNNKINNVPENVPSGCCSGCAKPFR